MYELQTAISYLIPRKGQLSISVVGCIAVLVIQAITWLILVFFSTTDSIETRWSQKIISVVGPMRITPTPAYFESPYYQLDFYSAHHDFSPERLSTKGSSLPYDPSSDPPLPPPLATWYQAHRSTTAPVATITSLLSHQSLPWRFFESAVCHMSIPSLESAPSQSLSQYTWPLGLDALNPATMAPVKELSTLEVERLITLLRHAHPKTRAALTPLVNAIKEIDVVLSKDAQILSQHHPQGTRLTATISLAHETPEVIFSLPNKETAEVPLDQAPPFSIIAVSLAQPPVAIPTDAALPYIPNLGYPTLLPKQMRRHGARLLDTGTFQFSGADLGGTQPLTIPFYIAGFFDAGILPIGGKLAITSRQAVMAIQPTLVADGPMATSGIIIDIPPSISLPMAQKTIQKEIDTRFPGLFAVQRFDQYEMTADLFQQLASEHTIFHLLAVIIIFVACSNIFSMLFILAHDRRKEIAVLRALGASPRNITAIFMLAGLGVGLFGSVLGAALAAITLHYLPELLSFIGALQGHPLLQEGIYGDITSQSLSGSTLLFSFITISMTSAIAGACAAVRACTMNVSEALRS